MLARSTLETSAVSTKGCAVESTIEIIARNVKSVSHLSTLQRVKLLSIVRIFIN